jgi:hypothetical protein
MPIVRVHLGSDETEFLHQGEIVAPSALTRQKEFCHDSDKVQM